MKNLIREIEQHIDDEEYFLEDEEFEVFQKFRKPKRINNIGDENSQYNINDTQ